ncbi:hypothetical protein AB0J86_06625 [Micromonospora sp. NPDC049559]|uniref:hypothetical protein n=1 Tax=Micromonospora sp. NPDC049559 TaxID=3155923 RepID=UPI0034185587
MSPEALGFSAAAASTIWAAFSEFMPIAVKAIVGSVLGAVAAGSAGRAWLDKRDERKKKDEDQ